MLSDKIKKRRKALGMSQEELADKIFVTRQTIYKWENNQAQPDLENVKSLCRVLQVTYEELLEDDKDIQEHPINYLHESEKMLKKHWRKIGYVLCMWGFGATVFGLIGKALFHNILEEGMFPGFNPFAFIPNLMLFLGIGSLCVGLFLIWKDYQSHHQK